MPRHKSTSEGRLNLKLSEQTRALIEWLKVQTNADTLSEVVRRAVTVYSKLLEEQDRGAKLVLRYKDGSEKELEIIP